MNSHPIRTYRMYARDRKRWKNSLEFQRVHNLEMLSFQSNTLRNRRCSGGKGVDSDKLTLHLDSAVSSILTAPAHKSMLNYIYQQDHRNNGNRQCIDSLRPMKCARISAAWWWWWRGRTLNLVSWLLVHSHCRMVKKTMSCRLATHFNASWMQFATIILLSLLIT